MKQYKVLLWDETEYYECYGEIEADNEDDAWNVAREQYSEYRYSIRDIREMFR